MTRITTRVLTLIIAAAVFVPVFAASAQAFPVRDWNALVIPVNADGAAPAFTRDEIQAAFFGPADSAASYYATESRGLISLRGTVMDSVSVPESPSNGPCDTSRWWMAAQQMPQISTLDKSQYNTIAWIYPPDTSCTNPAWGTLGSSTGKDNQIIMNGTLNVSVIAHEFGHNFGLSHASTLVCKDAAGAPVSLAATCDTDEYGDMYDVMGGSQSAGIASIAAWDKIRLGIFAGGVQTITQPGTYTLSPSEANAASTSLLQSPSTRNINGEDRYMFFEYHRPTDSNMLPAVTVAANMDPNVVDSPHTFQVNTDPANAAGLVGLAAGDYWYDPTYNIGVYVAKENVNGAVLRIGFTPDSQRPSAPSAFRISHNNPRHKATLKWRASADDYGIAEYKIYKNGRVYTEVRASAHYISAARLNPRKHYKVAAVDASGKTSAKTAMPGKLIRTYFAQAAKRSKYHSK